MKLASHTSSTWWYAILSALLITGFLLILTAWTFHLVLQELYDGRGKQNYLKAYAAAEAWLEEALYLVNRYDYGYHKNQAWTSDILSDDIRIPQVAFEFESKVQEYSWSLDPFDMDIIPLFWRDSEGKYHNIKWGLQLAVDNDIDDKVIAWNIIWLKVGVWWNWSFQSETQKVPQRAFDPDSSIQKFVINDDYLENFLKLDEMRFMILINNSSITQDYTLTSTWEYFTLPRHDIVSSGKIGRFTQNIRTEIDNTEYLGLLRYSIFWWE